MGRCSHQLDLFFPPINTTIILPWILRMMLLAFWWNTSACMSGRPRTVLKWEVSVRSTGDESRLVLQPQWSQRYSVKSSMWDFIGHTEALGKIMHFSYFQFEKLGSCWEMWLQEPEYLFFLHSFSFYLTRLVPMRCNDLSPGKPRQDKNTNNGMCIRAFVCFNHRLFPLFQLLPHYNSAELNANTFWEMYYTIRGESRVFSCSHPVCCQRSNKLVLRPLGSLCVVCDGLPCTEESESNSNRRISVRHLTNLL